MVSRNRVVLEVPSDDCCQPSTLLADGVVHPFPEFLLHTFELGREALAHSGSNDHKRPVSIHPALMGEPQEVEGLRFPAPVEANRVPFGKSAKSNEARLFRV